jgi:hypothetical protein
MNRVTHFEIPAEDKAASREFYTRVFDWDIVDFPVQMDGGLGTYTVATTVATDPATQVPVEPGAINGAIKERRGEVTAPVIFVTVSSVDEHLKRVVEAGGRVVEERREVTGLGHYAYVADPAGNIFGLWQDIPAEQGEVR